QIGARVDIWYAQESIQDRCAPLDRFQPDSDQKNLQTCDHFTADNLSLSVVGLSGSVLLRPLPQASMSPYLRAGVGLVIPTGETLSASGDFIANGRDLTREMIVDSSGQGPRGYGVLALGVQSGSGGSSRFQFEVSDAMIAIDRLTGPADVNGRAPRVRALTNTFSLTLGIAVVFSGRRGRRY
ncbi:MAG TPA: hypothetical protein VH163_02400, partial [Gemmatimonadales bacterium]|nr:hypothetical protein [Gemmatimonadales bacterium]